MSLDDTSIVTDSIPVVLALVTAITNVVNAKEDAAKQLDALETAAEAVKKRLDEIKFGNEGVTEGFTPSR